MKTPRNIRGLLKPGTERALIRMGNATRRKCEECPATRPMSVTRCCDKYFCEISEITARELGFQPERVGGDGDLPFMSDEGCVIPPQFRPVCTGFVCSEHFKNPHFAEKWSRLQDKLNSDPNLRRAVEKAKAKLGGLPMAIERFQREHRLLVERLSGGDRVTVSTPTGEAQGEVTIDDGGPRITVLVDGFDCSNSYERQHVRLAKQGVVNGNEAKSEKTTAGEADDSGSPAK